MIISFDDNLPICQKRQGIAATIQSHQVVIIAGETGSGKTTQIPKICLELGRGKKGMIGHTQPRRLAAKAVASRIAEELKIQLGIEVGYQIRFSNKTSSNSLIKVMTDGILLAETQYDKYLTAYDTIIIDEAHERSINIDFILGILKTILPTRPDLKVIITSATIDPGKFSKFFADAPIIEVSGRSYPVQIEYLTFAENTELNQQLLIALRQLPQDLHDVLIFLPGESEIHAAAKFLQQQKLHLAEILPLYSRLSSKEQQKVFIASPQRKIILATNVAETSITVPGIHYVIDPGTARISRYNYKNQLQGLTVEKISKASSMQRAGRCGRVAAGICIRLYSETDFMQRAEYTKPEILRTNLATVVLKMLVLNLGDIVTFPFLDPPEPKMLRDGYKLLEQIGAINNNQQLTAIGIKIAKLPIDPKIAVILIKASQFACLQEILIIASGLSVIDPREQTRDPAIIAIHKKYVVADSDFLAYLKMWYFIKEQQQNLSNNKFKQFCVQEHLSWLRIKEWQDVYHELLAVITNFGYKLNTIPAKYQAIHQALLTGFMLNTGVITEDKYYIGIKQNKFKIFPNSVLFKKAPQWVMALQILHTKDTYARVVAKIQAEYLEIAARHLLKYSYSEPIWQKKTGYVVVRQKASLYGLCVYAEKLVNYEKINPAIAREVFIRHALVLGEYLRPPQIVADNMALIAELEVMEHKTRQNNIITEEQVYNFYAQIIPENIANCKQFAVWVKSIDLASIRFTKETFCSSAIDELSNALPSYILNNTKKLVLEYYYDPSSKLDGITVIIPMADLNKLDKNIFTWLVPGLIVQRITELLKSLPKALRKNFVPAANFAEAIVSRISFGVANLLECIVVALDAITGIKLAINDFNEASLPIHLRFNYKVIDDKQQVLISGRDLAAIEVQLYARLATLMDNQTELRYIKPNATANLRPIVYTTWEFGALPEMVDIKKDNLTIPMYVALVDQKHGVTIEQFSHREQAILSHHQGLLRMLYLAMAAQVKYLHKQIPNLNKILLRLAKYINKDSFTEDLVLAVIQKTFLFDYANIRTQEEFLTCKQNYTKNLIVNFNLIVKLLSDTTDIYSKLDQQHIGKFMPVKDQLEHLFGANFIQNTPLNWLCRYPVYLQAIQHWLNNNKDFTSKATEFKIKILPFWQCYLKHQQDCNFLHPEVVQFRWWLEELRIANFAQHLKTVVSVSAEKLQALQLTIILVHKGC